MPPRTRHRPQRGSSGGNPLVTGDTGSYAGPQGGADPGPHISGDLQSREFGVPQADIPGGQNHLVNPQAKPAETARKPLRPADYHKYHGVPPIDDGEYETPPDDVTSQGKPAAEPKEPVDAVPVRIVQDHPNTYRDLFADSISVAASTSAEPTRLCNYDPDRYEVWLLNEDSTNNARIGSRADLIEGHGAMLPAVTNSYMKLKTQGELFAQSLASAAVKVSVIIITSVENKT